MVEMHMTTLNFILYSFSAFCKVQMGIRIKSILQILIFLRKRMECFCKFHSLEIEFVLWLLKNLWKIPHKSFLFINQYSFHFMFNINLSRILQTLHHHLCSVICKILISSTKLILEGLMLIYKFSICFYL